MNQEIERIIEDMEGLKTYCSGALAWVLLALPTSVTAWGELFNTLAAFLALVLVVWRMKHDMFRKGRSIDADRLEKNK